VTPLRALVVVLAGFAGGAMTAVVGAGSLASLPVLLAIGLDPVTANVTSAVGVVPGSAAGVYAYRHQLPGLGGSPEPVEGGPRAGPVVLSLGVLVAVYGGYFGAAVSVMYLAMLGSIVGGLQASNGAKNTLTGLSCGAACVVFVLRADPDWAAVGLLALGSSTGGILAGRYGRRLPDSALRVALIAIALVTAVVEARR